MRIFTTSDNNFKKKWTRFLESFSESSPEVSNTVAKVLRDIKRNGDAALIRYTKTFDHFTLNPSNIRITKRQIESALLQVSLKELQLFKRAIGRIRRFHKRQKLKDWSFTKGGARMGIKWTPLDKVGIYVPGGMAAYPSTVFMNAVPAQVAGVKRIVMVTPTPGGKINPYTIAAAAVVGIDEIYRIGGAQAIGALAYGTKSVPAVNKIVGPGNAYVAEAKKQVFGRVDIDMIAGPSEVLILADGSADPEFVASDLLSQAEHDPDARPVLISTSRSFIDSGANALRRQIKNALRQNIASQALRRNGLAVLAKNRPEAIDLANEMAPEHLLLMVQNEATWLKKIKNAGAIFVGNYTPVAAGDYLAGPNHVLPTAGTAKYASPLGVYDFLKASSILKLSRKSLEQLSHDIVKLSELEGLTAHGESVKIRLA